MSLFVMRVTLRLTDLLANLQNAKCSYSKYSHDIPIAKEIGFNVEDKNNENM